MPESVIVVQGSVPGYTAHWESGGSYVWLHKAKNRMDGRFKRDPVWLWFYHKGEGRLDEGPWKGNFYDGLMEKVFFNRIFFSKYRIYSRYLTY